MRAVVQRTTRAVVRVRGAAVGEIGQGLLVLLGVAPTDGGETAERLARRVATLRIFADSAGRMNLDVEQVGGQVLAVSQFTLFADTSSGHRPSFTGAGAPDHAQGIFEVFVSALRERGLAVSTGEFGAQMEVELVNDGPVTLVLSSGEGGWSADAG
jgi:D-tyrosyl-tRNA(Tyr) deacylase